MLCDLTVASFSDQAIALGVQKGLCITATSQYLEGLLIPHYHYRKPFGLDTPITLWAIEALTKGAISGPSWG